MKNIVVLISGSGSNLQSIIDACLAHNPQDNSNSIQAKISCVIANKPTAYGLERAAKANIANACIDHTEFESREAFDQALVKKIDEYNPDLVVLAGFMRILTPDFVQHYHGRLMNIHPSLLPKYPGLNTHQRAIEAGDTEAGATVHFVTQELDGGTAIIQAAVPVLEDDTPDSLAARILHEEHKIYPQAIKWFVEGRLKLTNGQAILENEKYFNES